MILPIFNKKNTFIKTRHDVQGKRMGVVRKWERCTVLELIIMFE